MRKRRARSKLILGFFFLCLLFWTFERLTRRPADGNRPRPARLSNQDPAQPDTLLPKVQAYNDAFAGLAPGYDPFGGENQDRITPLITKDRIMVKGRTVARKPPPVAPDTDPTFYPMARLFISSDSLVSPLNVRDPAALVMPPGN